jgi:hypothetical protein
MKHPTEARHIGQPGRRRLAWVHLGYMAGVCLLAVIPHRASAEAARVLDDFERLSGWTTVVPPGAQARIAQDAGRQGNGLRIDFDFRQGGGFIIVHKDLPIELPADYAFKFFMRAASPLNNFEFRLVDPSGRNVWWHRKREYSFPVEWKPMTVKPHHLEFAWGPAGGGQLKDVRTVEFVVSVVDGGKGSVWIDDLRLEPRRPTAQEKPQVHASSSAPGYGTEGVLAPSATTRWRSGSTGESQWLAIDFLHAREYGGLVIDWDEQDYARVYEVQSSEDGNEWTTIYSVTSGRGGREYVYLPDGESRHLRLLLQRSSRGHGYGLRDLQVKPYEFSASPNEFFKNIAADAPRGRYPKYFYGEQTYWTIVGADGDDEEALLNEEGQLELQKRGFSLEPFLYRDGRLITWADVQLSQALERGHLPVPSVRWRADRITLQITALASGQPEATTLHVRYRIENTGTAPQRLSLFLALRPFQVNPPWQSLNLVGGTGRIDELSVEGPVLRVNREKALVALSKPDGAGAMAFASGRLADFLGTDRVPPGLQARDPFGFASGALKYALELQPGEAQEVYLAFPFHDPPLSVYGADPGSLWKRRQDAAARDWEARLGRIDIRLPPGYEFITDTLKTTLAYILINRDGPALRPGSRCYARSWIRDGALTSTALLETGLSGAVRDFIEWYAGYQTPDGRIPCCLDPWGPDTVLEHDSQGEFIYAVAAYYRYTRDRAFLKRMWPHVTKAVAHIDGLRQQRLTEEFKKPEKLLFYGLMPESVSHEGYAAHPVHSYWDDFWVLRGLKDAADLATVLGDARAAARFAGLRDAFRRDLYASIEGTRARHAIDYIPASVELADLDPSSTAIALDPGGEQRNLPEIPLKRTFEIYREDLGKRMRGETDLKAYSPYEFRNVGALVRLGQREVAFDAIRFFLKDRRPAAWNEWAEVVWRDPKVPHFIGDMPHTWVGSEFIRALRSLFVFEDEADHALVIGAGLPREWVGSRTGVSVRGLPTPYGPLSYSLRTDASGEIRLNLYRGLKKPYPKIVLDLPLTQPLRAVKVNGKAVRTARTNRVLIGAYPAEVRMR